MLSKVVKISIVLLCLLALVVPSSAKSAAGEIPSPLITTPPAGAYVSTEVNPTSLNVGGTALVSVLLNNVPVEGYKSAEFTCTYNAGLVEKSNIVATNLFGVDAVVAIHEHHAGMFIVAVAGAESNRAMTSGAVFTFSAKALQAGQSPIQCTARASKGDNVPIDLPGTVADLSILGVDVSPSPFVPPTTNPGDPEQPAPTNTPFESPNGSLSGQILASKSVTVRLLDVNQVEITSMVANPDGTFLMTPLPGDYILVASASGFLSLEESMNITAGDSMELSATSLLAGDIDGNNVIDQFDALTLGMNYTLSTPEAADLNNDGAIDFLDLELLAENYRQTGPTAISSTLLGLLQKKRPSPINSPIPGPKNTLIAPLPASSPFPGPIQTVVAPPIGTQTTGTTGTTGVGSAFPGAPLCPTHDSTKWHGLWDSVRGCHYDHEHGQNPFTEQVAAAFPGFDIRAFQCGKEVGHCNPSSALENEEAHHNGKHGGMKWQVDTAAPQGCTIGFEDGQIAIDAYAVMHHNLGRQDVEFESRQHSGVFMLRQCTPGNPSDKGYLFVGQLIEYGQRVMPYQGALLPYPDTFQPSYDTPRGPYFTTECFGDGSSLGITCRPSFNFGGNNLSIWTSKPTGNGTRPATSSIAGLLFRSRDAYQRIDVSDRVHPFTWRFVCSSDGGITYNPVGCRYNNSTTTVQELAGRIPASWDNLAGFDTNPTIGRITAQGFVTRYGALNTSCTAAGGLDCQPIKMVNAFVGFYSSELSAGKVSNPTPQDTPESDIYFCGTQVCSETSPGAVPSGWIGSEN